MYLDEYTTISHKNPILGVILFLFCSMLALAYYVKYLNGSYTDIETPRDYGRAVILFIVGFLLMFYYF